jgi:hypothetical protein
MNEKAVEEISNKYVNQYNLMREALEAVEEVDGVCPWCHGTRWPFAADDGKHKFVIKHMDDCLHERALGKEKKE